MSGGAASSSSPGGGDATSSAAAAHVQAQTEKALLMAFERVLSKLPAAASCFPAATFAGGQLTPARVNDVFRNAMKGVVTNSQAELRTILSEERYSVAPQFADATSATATAADSESTDMSDDKSSASASAAVTASPSKRRKSKTKSPAKGKAAATATAAVTTAAAATVASASGSSAGATPTSPPVSILGQAARLAQLQALQTIAIDGKQTLVSTESKASVEQRLRDAAAQSKIAQRNALLTKLKALQKENTELTARVVAKREQVKAEVASIKQHTDGVVRAQEECNGWKPPAGGQ